MFLQHYISLNVIEPKLLNGYSFFKDNIIFFENITVEKTIYTIHNQRIEILLFLK